MSSDDDFNVVALDVPMLGPMAQRVRAAPVRDPMRPTNSSHFSLMRGDPVPLLAGNDSLKAAKEEALKLDAAANQEAMDVASLLDNLGLGQYTGRMADNGVGDLKALGALTEADMKNLGLNLAERIRLRRAIAIRNGEISGMNRNKDEVFGSKDR